MRNNFQLFGYTDAKTGKILNAEVDFYFLDKIIRFEFIKEGENWSTYKSVLISEKNPEDTQLITESQCPRLFEAATSIRNNSLGDT